MSQTQPSQPYAVWLRAPDDVRNATPFSFAPPVTLGGNEKSSIRENKPWGFTPSMQITGDATSFTQLQAVQDRIEEQSMLSQIDRQQLQHYNAHFGPEADARRAESDLEGHLSESAILRISRLSDLEEFLTQPLPPLGEDAKRLFQSRFLKTRDIRIANLPIPSPGNQKKCTRLSNRSTLENPIWLEYFKRSS